MKNRTTPNEIRSLKENEIFVFGSNLSGYHGGGAAATAYLKFGAKWKEGVGHHGQTYAIPTKDRKIETLPLDKISVYVKDFIRYARQNPDLTFIVTRIGCGLAGYKDGDIAPLFKEAEAVTNINVPESFWKIINP